MMRRLQRSSRGGWSLIEMVVLMGSTSAILSIVAVVSYGLLRLQSTTRKYDDARIAVRRLETMLRTDAHAAMHATLNAARSNQTAPRQTTTVENPAVENPVLVLQALAESITYQRVARRIERRVQRGSKEIHREAFLLPHGLSLTWELESADGVENVSAIFKREASAKNRSLPQHAWRISAVVGLDQYRLQQEGAAP